MEPDLNLAIQHHEQGRFNEAARVYEWILGQTPEDPFFLHLFGVLVHQRGGAPKRVRFHSPGLRTRASRPPPRPASTPRSIGEQAAAAW